MDEGIFAACVCVCVCVCLERDEKKKNGHRYVSKSYISLIDVHIDQKYATYF